MSINEEKMFILKMLEEGKITSEEAAKLIEALEGNEKSSAKEEPRQYKKASFQDEVSKMRERIHEWKKEFKASGKNNDFDRMVEDFASKAEKVGKNVAAATFGVVDKMIEFVGSYVDTNSFNVFGNFNVIEKSFEAAAVEGMDINIEGINGHILVKKHLDNKIVIRSRVRSPLNNADAILMFNETGNTVSLKINKTGNISVAHEVFLPAVKFKNIVFETTNGKIYVEDSISESFDCKTRNSHIDLMGVRSDIIKVNTKNAKIQVSYVIGKDIEINTNNSVIDIKHVKAQSLKAATLNGRISVENAQNYEGVSEMELALKTSNGGIKVNMNDMDNRGYKVKAHTTNGGVNLLIPNILYHNVNRPGPGVNFVEAESSGYEGYAEKVNISAETVNGYIEIVK